MFNAAKIKELRKRFKINQKVMADLLGIERSTYTRREKNDFFYGDDLVQIANFFRDYLPKKEYHEIIRKAFNAPEYEPTPEPKSEEESMIGIQLAHILEKLGKLEAKLELYHSEIESLKNLKSPAPRFREAGR
jgi:DNA-binding XRE family transcriptional regulator